VLQSVRIVWSGVIVGAAALALLTTPAMTAMARPSAHAPVPAQIPGPVNLLQPNGRQLTPAGDLVKLGNLPMGGALTPDGAFLWTVSTGMPGNDVRIVDTATHKVCQILAIPGASGGIALDARRHLAYVSGLANSRWQPDKNSMPGAEGDVVHVVSYSDTCGGARELRTIPVPPQPDPPTQQAFPPPREGLPATSLAWPQKLALAADGSRLLVPLNLANSAAVVDLKAEDTVTYAPAASYPFAAAITPNGRVGLVSNEGSGTVSVIRMATGTKIADVTVGPPLSHPQGIVVDPAGTRAYVALSASDQVVVINIPQRKVEATVSVGDPAGLGTKPTSVALSPDGTRLFATLSGADAVAVVAIPGKAKPVASDWRVVGRIPTAAQPQAVATSAANSHGPALLAYVSAEGLGLSANPKGPNPTLPSDPIFWAFNPIAPTLNVFGDVGYTGKLVTGQAGLMTLPTDAQVVALTPQADRQLVPSNAQAAPNGTVLQAGGPIKHVFFIVRENRSYDQVLGDVARGNGDPKLTVFGRNVTPNLHAFVDRFPLADNVYANSEASIQGHYWTAAASVPDYVTRNWVTQYAGRGRPNDFGTYAVTWPGNGYLFNRAEAQKVSYFNYGEAFMGGFAQVADRERTPKILAQQALVQAHSDIGPPFGGCFPGDMSIGTTLDGTQVFDSSMPAGAPAGLYSRVDCFRARFADQVAAGSVPSLSYISLTSDHTRGTQPGFPTPTSMVADSDLAIGQIVETISHSPVWATSAIFIVEDDSQDGADHVNAHRIPVAVVSPYAKAGVVVHTRYDLVSVVRSIELILGLRPLSLNDALATPMYDLFAQRPVNATPYTALTPQVDLLQPNPAAGPDSEWSSRLELDKPDRVSQADLDVILWHSVNGQDSAAPPPGPGAEGRDETDEDAD